MDKREGGKEEERVGRAGGRVGWESVGEGGRQGGEGREGRETL